MTFLLQKVFLRTSSMALKLVLRLLVMLFNWLLTLLDTYGCWVVVVLAVFCTLAAVRRSSLMLTAC